MHNETWKTYKSIFRIDFRVDFSLFNSLGVIANEIVNIVENGKFGKPRVTYSSPNNTLEIKCKIDNDNDNEFYDITIGTSFIIVFQEFSKGIVHINLLKTKAFTLFNEILSILKNNKIKYNVINRVGLRLFSIFEKPKETFESLLVKYKDKLQPLINYEPQKLYDVGYILEYKLNECDKLRVISGPYQDKEIKKYFQVIEPSVKQGLISDIDQFRTNYESPLFDHEVYIKEKIKNIEKIFGSLEV